MGEQDSHFNSPLIIRISTDLVSQQELLQFRQGSYPLELALTVLLA